jgi:hypothetical protein
MFGPPCKAAVTIKGEHFPCDWPTSDDGTHKGWAHGNKEAEAVWSDVDSEKRVVVAECQSIYDTKTDSGPMKCTRLLFPDHWTECVHFEHSCTWRGKTWFWTTDQQMTPQDQAEMFYENRGKRQQATTAIVETLLNQDNV